MNLPWNKSVLLLSTFVQLIFLGLSKPINKEEGRDFNDEELIDICVTNGGLCRESCEIFSYSDIATCGIVYQNMKISCKCNVYLPRTTTSAKITKKTTAKTTPKLTKTTTAKTTPKLTKTTTIRTKTSTTIITITLSSTSTLTLKDTTTILTTATTISTAIPTPNTTSSTTTSITTTSSTPIIESYETPSTSTSTPMSITSSAPTNATATSTVTLTTTTNGPTTTTPTSAITNTAIPLISATTSTHVTSTDMTSTSSISSDSTTPAIVSPTTNSINTSSATPTSTITTSSTITSSAAPSPTADSTMTTTTTTTNSTSSTTTTTSTSSTTTTTSSTTTTTSTSTTTATSTSTTTTTSTSSTTTTTSTSSTSSTTTATFTLNSSSTTTSKTSITTSTTVATSIATSTLSPTAIDCFEVGIDYPQNDIKYFSINSTFDCQSACQNLSACQFFVFSPMYKVCWLKTAKGQFTLNSDRISGSKYCAGTCFEMGIDYHGNDLQTLIVPSTYDCQLACQKSSECVQFTHHLTLNKCWLKSAKGQPSPKAELLSASKFCPVNFKVMVIAGGNSNPLNSVEIIDLQSPSSSCEVISNYPQATTSTVGGLVDDNLPMVCGGNPASNLCYFFNNKTWTAAPSMIIPRNNFVGTSVFYSYNGQKFFVASGSNSTTSEMFDGHVWSNTGMPPLPVTAASSCLTYINSTTVLLIGGIQNGKPGNRTFFLTNFQDQWTDGPNLLTAGSDRACGRILNPTSGLLTGVIVVGGLGGGSTFLRSVEILDDGATSWRAGPPLPKGIASASLVTDPIGGVVLIGGKTDLNSPLSSVYRLRHSGPGATWELMPQALKTARYDSSSFAIPNGIVNC